VAGLHPVRKRRKGADRIYVYAWRGGPCIHTFDVAPGAACPPIGPDILARQIEARARIAGDHGDTLETVITAYRVSPAFEKLRDTTKRDYRLWLDRISAEFGTCPLAGFEDRRMRGLIIQWRDRWRDQPRTADKATVMMGTLLAFAMEHGVLSVNVAAGIGHLHSARRAHLIWEERHWQAVQDLPAHMLDVLALARLTGLRLGDLLALTWERVGPSAIVLTTSKTGGRATIPIYPELRALLDRLAPDERKGAVLRSTRGAQWSADGFKTVWHRYRPEGFDRRLHDIRGTFATYAMSKGLTDQQVSMIMGWQTKDVAAIRERYVDAERVIVDLAARMSA